MIDINVDILSEYLVIATAGALFGVLLPWVFRLVGYLVDIVKVVIDT